MVKSRIYDYSTVMNSINIITLMNEINNYNHFWGYNEEITGDEMEFKASKIDTTIQLELSSDEINFDNGGVYALTAFKQFDEDKKQSIEGLRFMDELKGPLYVFLLVKDSKQKIIDGYLGIYDIYDDDGDLNQDYLLDIASVQREYKMLN